MLTIEQFFLTKLAEEASEIAQIALKTQQFGMDERDPARVETNRQRIHAELNDLITVVEILNDIYGLDFLPSTAAQIVKRNKLYQYLGYSQSLGQVEDFND